MRLIIAIVGLALAAMAAGGDQDIRKAEKEWAAAVAGGDFASVERMLSDQLIYAHSTGNVETKAEYLGKLRAGTQKYDGIEHQSVTVRQFGDTAVAHSKVRMHGKNQSGPFDHQLMMLHVWVKQGGRWQLAAHQTTRLP
jgi:ketosteroid isomerase-like protein